MRIPGCKKERKKLLSAHNRCQDNNLWSGHKVRLSTGLAKMRWQRSFFCNTHYPVNPLVSAPPCSSEPRTLSPSLHWDNTAILQTTTWQPSDDKLHKSRKYARSAQTVFVDRTKMKPKCMQPDVVRQLCSLSDDSQAHWLLWFPVFMLKYAQWLLAVDSYLIISSLRTNKCYWSSALTLHQKEN